ncbi:MAG TPA: hypothetical protein V6C81_06475 [Planktothrix sp.]|jgi:hypothetical protein
MFNLSEQEGDPQDNFVESRDPAELMMCFILSAAYLGLAKFVWDGLLKVNDWKLLINIEGFFITIAVLSILVGLRPYMSPSSLQLSSKGIKYRGPYWPKRKTVNWDQVQQIYLSLEVIIVIYQPKPNKKALWPMFITSIYLADRDNIGKAILRHSPVTPKLMTSPHIFSRLLMGLIFFAVVLWLLQLLSQS